MAKVGKGQELSVQERQSIEFIEKLLKKRWPKKDDDDCVPLQPSNHWSMIKAVTFTKDGQNLDYAKSSFISTNPVLGKKPGALCLAQSQKSPKSYAIEIHRKLCGFIKKRRGEKIDLKLHDEKRLKEFVEDIEKCCKFRIIASELEIHGYANRRDLVKPHCWRGRIDAIGVKKNGTIIVVDWRVCCSFPPDKFWDSRTAFPEKLHQTMIYREIIRAQWKDFGYEGEKDVGILIVPMADIDIRGSAPRECLKFELLKEKRFFYDLAEFEWTAKKPSKDGDGHRREQEIHKVKTEVLRDTRFIQRQIQVERMAENDVKDLLTTLLFLMDVSWNKEKQNLSEVLEKSSPDMKYAFLAKKYLSQLQSVSGITKQEPAVKAVRVEVEGEDYSHKYKTPDGDCGNTMKLLPQPPLPPSVEEIKEVRKPIVVKKEEPITQMPDWEHLSGRTPTDSHRTAEMYDTRNSAVGRVTQMPDLQHHIARTPVHRYHTPGEAPQLDSSLIQPAISAAQMAYGESAELEPYHFMVECL